MNTNQLDIFYVKSQLSELSFDDTIKINAGGIGFEIGRKIGHQIYNFSKHLEKMNENLRASRPFFE